MHTVSRRTGIRLYSRNRMFPFDIVKTGEAAPRSPRHGRCSMALARRLASPPRGRRSVVPRWRARCLRRLMTTNGCLMLSFSSLKGLTETVMNHVGQPPAFARAPAIKLALSRSPPCGLYPAMRSFLDMTNTPEDRHNLTARRWAGLKSLARLALLLSSNAVSRCERDWIPGRIQRLEESENMLAHPAVFMVIFVYLVPAQIE